MCDFYSLCEYLMQLAAQSDGLPLVSFPSVHVAWWQFDNQMQKLLEKKNWSCLDCSLDTWSVQSGGKLYQLSFRLSGFRPGWWLNTTCLSVEVVCYDLNEKCQSPHPPPLCTCIWTLGPVVEGYGTVRRWSLSRGNGSLEAGLEALLPSPLHCFISSLP